MANDLSREPPVPRAPATRAERQEQTRQALVLAARDVFARDGYHGARLERIAAEAGYSKGAVYSNFDGKADLFLAVMDVNLAAVGDEPWDPFDHVPDAVWREDGDAAADADADARAAGDEEQLAELMSGFGLATLEFIASATRDADLRAALAQRTGRVVELYTAVAASGRADDDPLPAEELGALLAALDQGMALLTLGGAVDGDSGLIRAGMRRLIGAGRLPGADDEPDGARADGAAAGRPGLHDAEMRRRIADSIRD